MCRIFEDFNLVWNEEPLDAYDHEGHAALVAQFATPIATGEMLTRAAEHGEHFDWLEPLFNERLEIKDGRMLVPTRPDPTRPGLGWVRA